MNLSKDLIDQFVKLTNDKQSKSKTSTISFGTAIKEDGKYYVKLDGGETQIPADISQVAAGVNIDSAKKDGTRVVVLISNHQASIIASLEPANTKESTKTGTTLETAAIDSMKLSSLEADNVKINNTLTSVLADIKYLNTNMLTADQIEALKILVEKLIADQGEFETLTSEKFATTDAFINNADITLANIDFSNIGEAAIQNLFAKQAFMDSANVTFANVDFANITKVAIENLFATSGLIENVIVGDGTITGNLVGVTIKGDLIEANTLVADKLVILGEDGLYYKLNTNGVTVEGEQTDYNSLNGSIITAKSITATQISVDDLVAFDATIGGFTIGENSIHSEVKDSEGNTTRGIYMDTDGQVNFGDESNFIKYYKDDNGAYKLAISAASIMYALNGKQYSLSDLGHIGEYVHIGTYEGEPCIELGDSDSDFKLVITNTRIMFMEGTSVPAYISNQSLHITKAVIEEEIQQGEFVWKVRSNGNMGLMWKGEA